MSIRIPLFVRNSTAQIRVWTSIHSLKETLLNRLRLLVAKLPVPTR
jgi:hypothetical protein